MSDSLLFTSICFFVVFTKQVDVMFKALSECQVLHPDPDNEEGEGTLLIFD